MTNRNYISTLSLSILTILILSNLNLLNAQVSEGFNYQAVARDAAGEIIPNTDIELRMSITTDPNAPGVVYSEEHIVTSDDFGMVNVVIGEGTPTNGDFNDIDWDDSEHHLMIRMTFNGIDATLPPVQFQAVPYAKIAATTSDKLWQEADSNDMSIYYNEGPVGIGTLDPQRNLEIAQPFDSIFLRLHSQGTPAGTAMIELVRGTAFSATDWRFGNTGSGFTFDRNNDNFTTPNPTTALFISNNEQLGINTTSPEYTLDVYGDGDYNTVRIRGYSIPLESQTRPALQFSYDDQFVTSAAYRLENDGTRFSLERSFNDFEDSHETMLSVNDNGNMNMHFHKIVDLEDPTQGDHAVTLSYMNNAIEEAMSSSTLELSAFNPDEVHEEGDIILCVNYCKDLTENGHSDWRVGFIEEYLFLLDPTEPNNPQIMTLTPSGQANVGFGFYSTYTINITNGSILDNTSNNFPTYSCRCVRGKK